MVDHPGENMHWPSFSPPNRGQGISASEACVCAVHMRVYRVAGEELGVRAVHTVPKNAHWKHSLPPKDVKPGRAFSPDAPLLPSAVHGMMRADTVPGSSFMQSNVA